MRGGWDNGLSYDFSVGWGESTIKYTLVNTLNASMGPATSTAFRPGDLVSDASAINVDFVLPIDAGLSSDLNLAFGFEYRNEGYDVVQGEPKSYEIGAYAFEDPWNFEIDADEAASGQNGGSVGCFIPGPQFNPTALCDPLDPIHNVVAIGSNGFPGYDPLSASTYDRDSWAAYFDLEADITERFLATVAGRYEDFSDFGSNFSFRLAGRLQLSESLAVRSSVGTGFRAPTPGQISTNRISTSIDDDGQPVDFGFFPATHPASQLFGAVPLRDETSAQFTFGFTAQPTDALTVTLDYYFIDFKDRLTPSSSFELGPAEVAQLEALGFSRARGIAEVRFLSNDADTETRGIDLVANYALDWRGGNTSIQLAANFNEAEVTNRVNRQTDPTDPMPVYFLDDVDVWSVSNFSPKLRANLTARHSWNNGITTSLRGSWWGDYEVNLNSSLTSIQRHQGKMYWDLELNWDINESYSITIGGNNIFDEFPDKPESPTLVGQIYRPGDALDWQGSYYYVRGAIRWY